MGVQKTGKTALAVFLVSATIGIALPEEVIFKHLVNFQGSNGSVPYLMSLAEGTGGAFYGTTVDGGATPICGESGCRTVFRISSSGKFTTLHHRACCSAMPSGARSTDPR